MKAVVEDMNAAGDVASAVGEVSPLLRAARAAVPLLAEHAAEADRERRLAPAVAEAIIEAGFGRHFAPTEPEGSGGTFGDLMAATVALGEGCPSSAWVASVIAGAGRLTAFLPREGREAVWEKGPDTVVTAGLVPAGGAEAVPGGWRVTGEWPYTSGIGFADWTLLAARTEVDGERKIRVCALPGTDYEVKDTWFTMGMRGTGSDTVTVDGAFVPEGRTVALEDLFGGLAPASWAPCFRVPLKAANGLTLTAPMLGASRRALRRWAELVAGKLKGPAAAISGGTDAAIYEQHLARADGEIDAAQLLMERVARTVDTEELDRARTARNARDCALAADILAGAVDRLVRIAGTRAHSEREELQRLWRDVNCGAGHSGLQFAPAASAYARVLNGE